ncbi:phage major capsid protein, HK97 family [Thermaerobacter marianensis DSM 12885]|uniref:Phage major capsid protein, HK97 family n=1 Tax=Thermaerobacter marianensis (strain ATCC 700841 / DSM 12885 / JCM 10246 / 7p75a) TaxID=644966 RepID=E6SKH7_THEM7|nr:phage major capsid protein, HK97 family [Thermaerobacter marianensis DSM 12885]
MDLKELVGKARQRVEEARRIVEEYAGKAMPADVKEQVDRLLAEAKELKAQADRAAEVQKLQAWLDEPQYRRPMNEGAAKALAPEDEPAEDGGLSEAQKKKQTRAFFKALRGGLGVLTREERELLNPARKGLVATKALVEDAAGEILVPEEVEAEIYRRLPKLTVIRPLATVRTTGSNRVRRRSLTELQVGWGKLETGTALVQSTPQPGEEYTYVEDLYGLTLVGEDELDDTDVNLTSFVADSFAQAIAEAEDTAFIAGTGHANQQPEGILNAADVPTVAAGQTAAITTDDILTLIYKVPAQHRRNGVLIANPETVLRLRLLKTTDGQYLWQPSLVAGQPDTFAGYPVYDSVDVPTIPTTAGQTNKVAIFGDVRSGYRILDRQGMTVKVLQERYADQGLIGYRVRYRVGGSVVRPEAFAILTVAA